MAARASISPSTTERISAPFRRAIPGTGEDGLDIDSDFDAIARPTLTSELPYDASLEQDGKRSLATIGLHAFWLGFAFAAGLIFSIQLAYQGHTGWRLCAFVTCLALFHFLEYWTTARFNLPAVRSNSFLLFNNGAAYNIAYMLAIAEMLLSTSLFKSYSSWMTSPWSRTAGLVLVMLGQLVRSIAMAQAGTNFNHIPQKTRKEGHELVTAGVYGWLRHPSYFGFFYWAIGTQLLVGNKLCTIGYMLVLWRFFQRRIIGEERSLVDFFGERYLKFRAITPTGIPFIK